MLAISESGAVSISYKDNAATIEPLENTDAGRDAAIASACDQLKAWVIFQAQYYIIAA